MASPPGAGATRPHRRWPRRLLIAANVIVAVCLVATASAFGYVKWRFGQIDRISIGSLFNRGDDDPGEPMNVLLVGSDSREDLGDESEKFGTQRAVGGQRSDTMMVLRVDPRAEKAAILSVPRDLYVPIAGTGGSNRINTAFFGGAERLVSTIQDALDIPIHHYAEVDFNGFRGIVEAVGGVVVYFPGPARDTFSGLNQRQAGCIKLGGEGALAYVRSRHYQYYEGGRWHSDPTGDLGRIERQQDFIRRVIKTAISGQVLLNPLKWNRLVDAGVKNVTLDDTLSTKDLRRLAERFKSLSPEAVDMFSLPTTATSVRIGSDRASVLKLKEPEATAVIDDFLGRNEPAASDGPIPDIATNTVRLRALNGSGQAGQAGKAASALTSFGFRVTGTGDADSFSYTRPVIRYGRGQEPKARLLAAYVVGGAEVKADSTLQGVDLELVTGSAWEGLRAPGAPAPSTTAPPATAKPATDATPKVPC